jgi:hypothetical protein
MLVTVRLVRDNTPTAPSLNRVDWSAVHHPMECGELPQQVTKVAVGDATGDNRAEAVVVVRCAAGAGSPPSGVFVYGTQPGRPDPQLLADLIRPDQDVLVEDVKISVEGVTVRGLGYSAPDVPRCCPDRQINRRWQWSGAGFAQVE